MRIFGRQASARFSLERLAISVIVYTGIAVLAYLTICSLFVTGVGAPDLSEHVLLQRDFWGLRLVLVLPGLFLLKKLCSRWLSDVRAQQRLNWACAGVCIWCFCFSAWWGMQFEAAPNGDMSQIWLGTMQLLKNQYDFLDTYYYIHYPFQLGTALCFEMLFRLLHTTSLQAVAVFHAVWSAVIVYCGYRITGVMSGGKAYPQGIYLALAAVCFQPMLLSPMVYGDVASFGCMFLAVWWAMRFYESRKMRFFFGIAAVLFAGTLVRNTLLITALAILLVQCVLSVSTSFPCTALLRRNRAKYLLATAGMLAVFFACLHTDAALNRYMRFRAGIQLPPGDPKSCWLVMGAKTGERGCGWFDGWPIWVDEASHGDPELMDVKSRIELKRLYENFLQHPLEAAQFFQAKLASEWMEPAFQSIHPGLYQPGENGRIRGSTFAEAVFYGGPRKGMLFWMDQHESFVFLGALTFLLHLCFVKQKHWQQGITGLLPIVVVLGGFFFYFFGKQKAAIACRFS